MSRVAIVSAVRTPIGRYGGALKDVHEADLAALVICVAVNRAGVDPASVEEVIMGHCLVNGETPNVARLGALKAGLPIEVPAYTLDRQCSSGLQAIVNGALLIKSGEADVVVAGGVESMSRGDHYTLDARWGTRMGDITMHDRFTRLAVTTSCPDACGPIDGMIGTAEKVAEERGITREEADEFALRSQRNASAAMQAGKFDDEIIPVTVPGRRGQVNTISQDEGPRPDASLEALAKLPPVQGGVVTAGNASTLNDAAAAVVLMSDSRARELGVEPLGYLRSWAAAGVHPHVMGVGPVPAIRKALGKAALTLEDMDLIELNEAFAVQALAVLKDLGVTDFSKLNVNGSGISLGHPVGATGARMMATLLYEMKRRDARYGLETMCIGGGQGLAAVVERDV
ncbi:MAG TPA: acetyl-CoA C-acetyltransferase [Chloroflexota bacterium]|nr:acetyl-CoA C-acetyltransferase [Chloroflexota bacterium]